VNYFGQTIVKDFINEDKKVCKPIHELAYLTESLNETLGNLNLGLHKLVHLSIILV